MNKEKFKNILNLQAEHYQKEQKLYDLGVSTLDINESIVNAIELLWSEVLTDEGVESKDWFLYEKFWISGEPKEDIKAWDREGNEIIRDLDELYEYLTVNSSFHTKND